MSTELWDGNAHLSPDEKALIEACKKTGDAAEVRRLLAAGVGVDIRDGHNMPWDQTPLMLAAHNGFLEIVQILLAAGASVSTVDKDSGESDHAHQPLHHAVLGQNMAVVEAILAAGADINALTTDGNTPLNKAIYKGNLSLMKLLIDRGAAVKKFSRKKFYPPLCMVSHSHISWENKPAMVEMLLKAGADLNEVGARNTTALDSLTSGHDVDNENRLKCLSALLEAGAKDLPNKDGSTALAGAAYYSNFRAMQLLIDAGSNINYLGRRGTLLDVIDQQVKWLERDLADPKQPDRLRDATKRKLEQFQELIEQLIARGGKRKADLTPEDIAAANPPAEKKSTGVKATNGEAKPKSPPLGASHFLKLANRGEQEWSLFAIEAPLEKVTEALSQHLKIASCQRGIEIKKTRKNDELARHIAVVQIKDNPWIVVLRSLFYLDRNNPSGAEDDAKALSAQLKTKAISFVAEDTSARSKSISSTPANSWNKRNGLMVARFPFSNRLAASSPKLLK